MPQLRGLKNSAALKGVHPSLQKLIGGGAKNIGGIVMNNPHAQEEQKAGSAT